MTERLILPPKIVWTDEPIIFLAGPIQGAGLWQDQAFDIIHSIDPNILVASPRREYLDEEFIYENQVDWETTFLRRAGFSGVTMFWLARELYHDCDRAFAQTSRFELAESKLKHQIYRINLSLGIEQGFSNEKYIRRRFSQDCPNIKIYSTLEETCRSAVSLLGIEKFE